MQHDSTPVKSESGENRSPFIQAVGKRLAELRERKNLSQRQAGEKLGLDHSHLGKYERGEIEAGIEFLSRLHTAYGVVDMNWLVYGTTDAIAAAVTDLHQTIRDVVDVLGKRIPQVLPNMSADDIEAVTATLAELDKLLAQVRKRRKTQQ